MLTIITGAKHQRRSENSFVMRQQLYFKRIHRFALRKWASNNEELLADISASATFNHTLDLHKDETKTLGIIWNPTRDVFQYKIHLDSTREYSKRIILSDIASIFDPLEFLAPVILMILAKIMIQKLWKFQISWDKLLSSDIYTEWSDYVMKIQDLNSFMIQHATVSKGLDVWVELHGFCDASKRAYGACVYVCNSNSQGIHHVQLLSRVALIKTISIPRTELCGIQLLTQQDQEHRIRALDYTIERTYYWTDSSIVLHWIKAMNKKLSVFIAHWRDSRNNYY